MTEYKSYYYVIRKGKGWEIYSTCHQDWVWKICYESYEDALRAIENEKKQTRA